MILQAASARLGKGGRKSGPCGRGTLYVFTDIFLKEHQSSYYLTALLYVIHLGQMSTSSLRGHTPEMLIIIRRRGCQIAVLNGRTYLSGQMHMMRWQMGLEGQKRGFGSALFCWPFPSFSWDELVNGPHTTQIGRANHIRLPGMDLLYA